MVDVDKDETPPLFPAREVGFSIGDDGEVTPTVAIEAVAHPEVSDLARVHALEGIGDVRTGAQRIRGRDVELLLLGVALSRPVSAAFAVSFHLPGHREFLEAVCAHGRLAIATTDPSRVAAERPAWLAVDVDGPALMRALE